MSKYSRSNSIQGEANPNESNQFTLKGEEEEYESSLRLDSYKFFIEHNKKNTSRSKSSSPIQINSLAEFSFSENNPEVQEQKLYLNDRKDINKANKIPMERMYKNIFNVTFTKNKKKVNKKRNEKISKSLPPNQTKENFIYINNENEQNEGNHIPMKDESSPIKDFQNVQQKKKNNSNINENEFEYIIKYISNEDIKSEDMKNPLDLDMNFESNSKENERRFLSCDDNDIFYNNISTDKEIPNTELNIYNSSIDKNEENKEKDYNEWQNIKLPKKENENIFGEKDKKEVFINFNLSEINNENRDEINNNDEFYKNKLSIDKNISLQNNNSDSEKFSCGNNISNESEKINISYKNIVDSGIESSHKEVQNKKNNNSKDNSLNNSYNSSKDNFCNADINNCCIKIYENKAINDSNNDELFIKCKNFLTQIYDYKNNEKGKEIISISNEKDKDLTQNIKKEILFKKEKMLEEKDENIVQKSFEKEKEIKIELLDESFSDDQKTKEINEILNEPYISYGKEKEKKKEISHLKKEEQRKNIKTEPQSKNNQIPIYLEENKKENLDNSIIEEIIEIKDSAKKVEKSKFKIKKDQEIKKENEEVINIKEEEYSEFCETKGGKINMNVDKDFFEKIKLQIKNEIYSDILKNNSPLSHKSKPNLTKLKKEIIELKDSDSDNPNSDEDNKNKNKVFIGKKRKRNPLFEIDHSIKFNCISEISRTSGICLNKYRNKNFLKTEYINGNSISDNDDLEKTIIKSIEKCALNCIYEKIITKSFSSGIELDRKIMEIIKTRGYLNVKSSLNNFRKNQILSIEEVEKPNINEIEMDKKIHKEFHYNVINDFYYRYQCINIKQNIQKYVCCAKDCNGLAELNLSEKKFVIIQKHSIPPKFHPIFNIDKPIKFMKKRKLEEVHIKRNDHNNNFHLEWFK